jgi:hypothetical protein
VKDVRVEEDADLVTIHDTLSALLEVKCLVKAGVIEIGRDVTGNSCLADFAPRLSRFSNIANVFSESVVACHTPDAFRYEHRVCFCGVHSNACCTYSPMSKQEIAKRLVQKPHRIVRVTRNVKVVAYLMRDLYLD